jgi:hypothetical protein
VDGWTVNETAGASLPLFFFSRVRSAVHPFSVFPPTPPLVPDFDSVGEALLTALGSTLGPDYTTAIHDAWADAYALLSAVMKRASVRSETGAETA